MNMYIIFSELKQCVCHTNRPLFWQKLAKMATNWTRIYGTREITWESKKSWRCKTHCLSYESTRKWTLSAKSGFKIV